MRTDERIAEELRILRAARDGRLYTSDVGRWMIAGEPRPCPKARAYLQRTARVRPAFPAPAISDKGRAMLADHEGDTQ